MSIKRVAIEGHERLEGALREGAGRDGVVLAHPHPLYGGSMENGVVGTMEDAFSLAGFTTLKFNFRGVGASTGVYDEGEGETTDLLDACRFLREAAGVGGRLILAGYSFGAWICARAAEGAGPDGLFLVAYPFSRYDASELRAFPGRLWFVGGSFDDISPLDALLALYKDLPNEKWLKVVPSSHFFEGAGSLIVDFIRESFGKEKG